MTGKASEADRKDIFLGALSCFLRGENEAIKSKAEEVIKGAEWRGKTFATHSFIKHTHTPHIFFKEVSSFALSSPKRTQKFWKKLFFFSRNSSSPSVFIFQPSPPLFPNIFPLLLWVHDCSLRGKRKSQHLAFRTGKRRGRKGAEKMKKSCFPAWKQILNFPNLRRVFPFSEISGHLNLHNSGVKKCVRLAKIETLLFLFETEHECVEFFCIKNMPSLHKFATSFSNNLCNLKKGLEKYAGNLCFY